jgi:hypothetical protein
LKYDHWQRECQSKFGLILSEEIKREYKELTESKSKLESIYFEGPTRDVIIGVEYLLRMKNGISTRRDFINDLEASEKLLKKQNSL